MSDVESSSDRYASMIGEPVVVTFSDGGQEAGFLRACRNPAIEVEHCDMTGGGHFWTATYTLVGDDETPHVVSVVVYQSQVVHPQQDALFA